MVPDSGVSAAAAAPVAPAATAAVAAIAVVAANMPRRLVEVVPCPNGHPDWFDMAFSLRRGGIL